MYNCPVTILAVLLIFDEVSVLGGHLGANGLVGGQA